MWRSAVLAGIGCVALCAPAHAADGVNYAVDNAGSGKGVVALTSTDLSFQFYGLRPNTRFKLVISSKGCASGKGVITGKAFRTNARGFYWDPAPVRVTAVPRTAKIMRGSKTVGCAPMVQAQDDLTSRVSKIGNATPAILVVDQTPSTWRTAMSITGLRKNAAYQLVGLNGPCARTSPVVVNRSFTANSKGAALVDTSVPAVAGQSILSVGVQQVSNQEVVFCKTL